MSIRRTALSGVAALALLAAPAAALPVGGTVVAATPPGAGVPGTSITTGANTVTIDQTSDRVVIDWRGFDVGAGESVRFNQGAANWVAFNRVTSGSPTTINGAISADGGVWLFAPGGLLFGPNARVNVGSFFGGTGVFGDGEIGDAIGGGRLDLGGSAGALTVQSGAVIQSGSGGVVLQAGTIRQDGVVQSRTPLPNGQHTSRGDVGYLLSEGGSVATSGDPDPRALADTAGGALDHGGFTRGRDVAIVAQGVRGAARATVINLDGVIEATGLSGSGGNITILGGSPAPGGAGQVLGGGVTLDASGGSLSAANTVRIEAERVELGSVGAENLDVRGVDLVALRGETFVSGVTELRAELGDIEIAAPANGGELIAIAGRDLTVGNPMATGEEPVGIRVNGLVELEAGRDLHLLDGAFISTSEGDVRLSAVRDVIGAPTSSIVAGGVEGVLLADVEVRAGRFGAEASGGDVSLGQVAGRSVTVTAAGVAGDGGLITLAGDVFADGTVLVESSTDTLSATSGGLNVLGDIAATGDVLLFNLGAGDIRVGDGVTVRSDIDNRDTGVAEVTWLLSYGDIDVGAGASVIGPQGLTVDAQGLLSVGAGGLLSAPGTRYGAEAAVWPYAPPAGLTAGVHIAARDIALAGTVVSGAQQARQDIDIEIRGGGTATIGGDGGSGGFGLSAAEFGRMTGRDVRIQGEPTDRTSVGADLVLGDLTLDPARISSLWLGTSADATLAVTGQVVGAGVDLHLGFARATVETGGGGNDDLGEGSARKSLAAAELDGREVVAVYAPGEISITGGLSGMGDLALLAAGDILIGADAFVAAARADPAFDAVRRSRAFPVARNRVFVESDTLQLAATGRILQQNTAGGLFYAGFLTGAPTADRPLFIAPDIQLAGRNEGLIDFAAGPIRADLFGAFRTQGGGLLTGRNTAAAPFIVQTSLGERPQYRINTCDVVGVVCAPLIDVGPLTPEFDEGTGLLVEVPLITSENQSFVVLPAPEESDEEADDGIASPITGSGNEDLWTSPVEVPAP